MTASIPSAKGSLAATPLAHLLIYALDRRLSGSIVFEEPGHAKHAIHFVEGAPSQARTAAPVALLGELARLDAERLEAVLADARQAGRRLGEALVERDLLDPQTLEALLREQVVRRLEHLAGLPAETAYGYYEGRNFLERAGGPSSPPQPLGCVWRVIRRGVEPRRVQEHLARLGNGPLRFHTEAPLGRFDFAPHEQAVIDVLRAKPQPLAELLSRGLAAPDVVELLAYTFSALRCFDTGSGTRPIGSDRTSGSMQATDAVRFERVTAPPPTPAVHPPAPSPTPAPAAAIPAGNTDPLRNDLTERLGRVGQSYYQVLGVPIDAPVEAIASAFFQLAKRFHPDRLGPGQTDVRELATRLFARMTEANQVLSDPTRRQEYDELLKHGEGAAEEQEEVLRVVRATTSFQKAQVLLKRNNLAAAEAEARSALADDPQQADHVALVAWIDASKPSANLEEVLKVLNGAVKMEEANLRVRWYRGQILKRLGQERRAVEDFRFIAERDPRHVDAQRELRLFDMRRTGNKLETPPAPTDSRRPKRTSSNPPPPAEKGGFFGKLFKR